jgi:hypothetical protein
MNSCIVLDQKGKAGGFTKSLLRKRHESSLSIRGTNQNEFIMCISLANDKKPIDISEAQSGTRV